MKKSKKTSSGQLKIDYTSADLAAKKERNRDRALRAWVTIRANKAKEKEQEKENNIIISGFNPSNGVNCRYNKTLFLKEKGLFKADEVQIGFIIALANGEFFHVDDIDKFFINDKVSKLYKDDDFNVLPEHTKITFYDEIGNVISDVPGEALCICYGRENGKHKRSSN